MIVFSAEDLRRIGVEIFTACGAPPDEAAIVADELVDSNLMGLDSHGVVRYIEYVGKVLEGKTKPGAPVRIVKDTPTVAVVDCGFNFGPVASTRMVNIVCEKARKNNIAYAVSKNCTHIGRLGGVVQKVAEQGLFGLATCNSSKHGHWVVPWGGRQGRLATNPLAFAAPTGGDPVVLDMSTSMISEGKVRVLMNQGLPVPEGCIQDADGNPTTDAKHWYGPPKGTILPFGSELGYKGFGLSLLVEILSGIMAGEASTFDASYINGLSILAIDPGSTCGAQRFTELMDDLCAYMTSTPPAPGFDEVVMPGAYDFRSREKRLAEGISIDDNTWKQIVASAESIGARISDKYSGALYKHSAQV
ncbi:MAG: Ldh family oxidoreductase [Armatimonadetes bacterium]|nr:Ldh family oxidoreductase [Armatimonadota bacterium]